MSVPIRPHRISDLPALERCIVEMQEFERAIDPRLRPGVAMASAYAAHLLARCAAEDGVILVAETPAPGSSTRQQAQDLPGDTQQTCLNLFEPL